MLRWERGLFSGAELWAFPTKPMDLTKEQTTPSRVAVSARVQRLFVNDKIMHISRHKAQHPFF